MTDHTDERITPVVAPTFREQRVIYWRDQARQNYALGFMDLARRCESNATDWEWEQVPCAS
jgi:hypothetical protein